MTACWWAFLHPYLAWAIFSEGFAQLGCSHNKSGAASKARRVAWRLCHVVNVAERTVWHRAMQFAVLRCCQIINAAAARHRLQQPKSWVKLNFGHRTNLWSELSPGVSQKMNRRYFRCRVTFGVNAASGCCGAVKPDRLTHLVSMLPSCSIHAHMTRSRSYFCHVLLVKPGFR